MRVVIATLASFQQEGLQSWPESSGVDQADHGAAPNHNQADPEAPQKSNQADSEAVPMANTEVNTQPETAPDLNHSLNASVASVEVLIPESMDLSAESLNSEDPTSHPS